MGNAESQPVRNVDKRTARRDHRGLFAPQIAVWRAERGVGGVVANSTSEPWTEPSSGGRLRVVVRKRPFFEHESRSGEFDVVTCADRRSVTVHDCRLAPDCRHLFIDHRSFCFDAVFDETCTSEELFAAELAPLVSDVACGAGGPCTILMYGQTGSGKTYTMGHIMSAAAAALFDALDADDVVSAAIGELGASGARDLLNGGAPCQVLTDHAGEVQLMPHVEVEASSAAGLVALLDYATAVRATAATGVHDASSRSHAIVRIHVQRASAESGDASTLTLVDLAGSEQRIDSAAHDAARAKESAAINASLMVRGGTAMRVALRTARARRPTLRVYRRHSRTRSARSRAAGRGGPPPAVAIPSRSCSARASTTSVLAPSWSRRYHPRRRTASTRSTRCATRA